MIYPVFYIARIKLKRAATRTRRRGCAYLGMENTNLTFNKVARRARRKNRTCSPPSPLHSRSFHLFPSY